MKTNEKNITLSQMNELIEQFITLEYSDTHYPHTLKRCILFVQGKLDLDTAEMSELYRVIGDAINHIKHLNTLSSVV